MNRYSSLYASPHYDEDVKLKGPDKVILRFESGLRQSGQAQILLLHTFSYPQQSTTTHLSLDLFLTFFCLVIAMGKNIYFIIRNQQK